MSAPVVQIQRKAEAGYQKVLKIREECEMRFTIGMAKVNRWLPESFTKKSSVKLLGGLAVGAMLITATTFTYDQLRQDEAASPSSSSQTTEASQAASYWIHRDEVEEMAYGELSKSFVPAFPIWCKSALRQIVNISVLIVYIQANPKGMGYNCAMISPNMEE
jgi:hypothetical protein